MHDFTVVSGCDAGRMYDWIERDFPKVERPPRERFIASAARGAFVLLTYEREGEAAAYAVLTDTFSTGTTLLYFLGIDPKLRGQGIGGAFVRELLATWPDTVFVTEAERPDQAADEGERELRMRRLGVYERLGFSVLDVRYRIFGVDMHLMAKGEFETRRAGEILRALYRGSVPPSLLEAMVLAGTEIDRAGGAKAPPGPVSD